MTPEVAAKTALHRRGPSAPLKLLLERHAVVGRVLDYGCGHGADVQYLASLGYEVVGWDPRWAPTLPEGEFDTVLCTYVLNVVPKKTADRVALEARSYLNNGPSGGKVFYTVRSGVEESASQRLVTSIPRAVVYARGSGFVVWTFDTLPRGNT